VTSIKQIKDEQHDEESELLSDIVNTKLEAFWAELSLLRRALRHVTADEGLGMTMGIFFGFTAQLAVEHGETKEEFLRSMGEAFEEMSAAMGDGSADEEYDKLEEEPS
jgi:hypothetical protein